MQTPGQTSRDVEIRILSPESKRVGVFATRDLDKGTRILTEKPLLVRHNNEDLEKQISALPPDVRRWYDTLEHISVPGKSAELSRFEHNSWPCPDLGADVLFYLTARINHSCVPNAIQFFNPVLEMNTVQLAWAVKENDEITICYIEPSMAHWARSSALMRRWGFRCHCVICQNPDSHDWERERIGVLRRCLLLGRPIGGEEQSNRMHMAMELMNLLDKEGLSDYLPLAYRTMKEQSLALGDMMKMREWEGLEQEVEEMLHGRDDDVKLNQ